MSAEQKQEAVVKPLEWVATGQTGFLECQYYAVSGPLRHSVHPLSAEDGSFFEHYDIRYSKTDNAWCLIYWVGNNGLSGINGHFPTLEAAKAAAQADYERRVRSALTPAASSQERIAQLEALLADEKRRAGRMANDWFEFCEAMKVTPDTHEAVAYELHVRIENAAAAAPERIVGAAK